METTNSNFSSMTLFIVFEPPFLTEATLFSDGLYFDRLHDSYFDVYLRCLKFIFRPSETIY